MADQQVLGLEIEVVIYEVRHPCQDHEKPEIHGKPYETVMERFQEFETVFERWHKHHEHHIPLRELQFRYYSLGDPDPIPAGFGPGPINQSIVVKPNDTPDKVKITAGKLNLYVLQLLQEDAEAQSASS